MAKLNDFIELHRRSETTTLGTEVLINASRIMHVRRYLNGFCKVEFENGDFVEPAETYDQVRALLTAQPVSTIQPADDE